VIARPVGTLAIVAVLAAACTGLPPTVLRDYAAYTGRLPSAAGSSERTARVTLREGGFAAVQLSSAAPGGDFFAEGTWQQADNAIVIELSSALPERLVFRRSGNLMIGKQWNRALWGEAQPVLYLVR
jgi:hypothetical protein